MNVFAFFSLDEIRKCVNTGKMDTNEIIDAFGGVREMHRKTGIPLTTIQSWRDRGAIAGAKTVELQRRILKAAREHQISVSAEDLIGEAAT